MTRGEKTREESRTMSRQHNKPDCWVMKSRGETQQSAAVKPTTKKTTDGPASVRAQHLSHEWNEYREEVSWSSSQEHRRQRQMNARQDGGPDRLNSLNCRWSKNGYPCREQYRLRSSRLEYDNYKVQRRQNVVRLYHQVRSTNLHDRLVRRLLKLFWRPDIHNVAIAVCPMA